MLTRADLEKAKREGEIRREIEAIRQSEIERLRAEASIEIAIRRREMLERAKREAENQREIEAIRQREIHSLRNSSRGN